MAEQQLEAVVGVGLGRKGGCIHGRLSRPKQGVRGGEAEDGEAGGGPPGGRRRRRVAMGGAGGLAGRRRGATWTKRPWGSVQMDREERGEREEGGA